MKVTAFVVADYASVSQGDKLNVLGIFDTIGARGFPVVHRSMVVALRLLLEYEDTEEDRGFVFTLEGPDGKKVIKLEGKIPVGSLEPGQPVQRNQIFKIQDLSFPRSGAYTFRYRVDGQLIAETPLRIIKRV